MITDNIQRILKDAVNIRYPRIELLEPSIVADFMDKLVWEGIFSTDLKTKRSARWVVWNLLPLMGVFPSSINEVYKKRGAGEIPSDFTVPAMNFRIFPYYLAKKVFATAREKNAGTFIFEIAKSEMGYTFQDPEEYSFCILAAALSQQWTGPVFIQGDHFQAQASIPGVAKDGEISTLKKLISEALSAGFYNIDIDSSTLVNLPKEKVEDQQKPNIEATLELARYIRNHEPAGVTVSIGGEIGHIGGRNSTVEDFTAFMEGLVEKWPNDKDLLSKISVQTGTSHGGKVLSDGSVAPVDVDFSVLEEISKVAKQKYKMGGAVQHGASTLSNDYFSRFPAAGTLEIHLATGFQNLILDHSDFPSNLKDSMYDWLDKNKISEKKSDWNDYQFYYKLRKKSLGHFKKELWSIPMFELSSILKTFENKIGFLFDNLNVGDTMKYLNHIEPVFIPKEIDAFCRNSVSQGVDDKSEHAD